MEILETKINEKTQDLKLLVTIKGELFEVKIPKLTILEILNYEEVEIKQLAGLSGVKNV